MSDSSPSGISHTRESSEVTIVWPKGAVSTKTLLGGDFLAEPSKKSSRKKAAVDNEEPFNDTTAKLALHSKRTERHQRRLVKKESRRVKSEIKTLLDFPHEILIDVLGYLLPSDVFILQRVSHASNEFVLENETAIASRIIQQRYWVLGQSFPLPVPLSNVDDSSRHALLSERWQDRLKIHKNPYQHIQHINPALVCTCMSCVLAWNNLNIILDLGHWQTDLENRQPLPVIARGKTPEWNTELLEQHASIVRQAMESPIVHARILQTHLDTIVRTIVRNSKWRKKGESNTATKPRLYRLTDMEIMQETDDFLQRSGPPSYQPIYMRDNYYSVEAFVPNRKWDKEEMRWKYYSKWPQPHLNDLAWLATRFTS